MRATLCLADVGKLRNQLPVKGADQQQVCNIVNTNINQLCFVSDILNNRQFMIDTGAEVSVIPATLSDKHNKPPSQPLRAANGTLIPTFGSKKLQFQLGTDRYEWTFVIAEVERPLIGADFLRHSGLLVDVRTGKLIRPDTFQALQVDTATFSSVLCASKALPNSYQAILE